MKKLLILFSMAFIIVLVSCNKDSNNTKTTKTTSNIVTTTTTENPINRNLLLWYKFDETSGEIATDHSENGFHGTLENGASWTEGRIGGALVLGNFNGYVKIPNGVLQGINNVTISTYVNLEKSGGSRWLFGLGPDNNKYIFVTPQSNGGKLRSAITSGSYMSEKGVEGDALTTGVWANVTLVISGDKGTQSLYVNGELIGKNTNGSLKPSDIYDASKDYSGYIGKSLYSADPYLKGKVDEFKIYDKALTEEEIKSIIFLPTDIVNVSFPQIENAEPLIDYTNHKITLVVRPGIDLTKLRPTFTLKTNRTTITPSSNSEQDFSQPVTYIVKAEDGKETNWTVEVKVYANPVLSGYYGDPNIAVFGDTYYIYPTTDGFPGWSSTYFEAFSSKDLINWTNEGVILNLANISWGKERAWAPTIALKDDIYYFYFSNDTNIGVATSSSPTGPFTDPLGEPLVAAGSYPGQMIDPQAFIDDDGKAYLYWGNGRLYVAELNDDMISLKTASRDITPTNFREGVFMFKRNGTYYLTWSEDDTGSENYQVAYAMSQSPTGPFVRIGTILRKNTYKGILATGHQSVLQIPGKDEYYMVYHRFAIPGGNGTHREVCIDKIEFNENGYIKPIRPTLEGITTPVYP